MTREEQIEYLKSHKSYDSSDDLFYEKRMLDSNNTIPICELVERMIEIDKEYDGNPWNIKQILANIDIIIPVEDRQSYGLKSNYSFVDETDINNFNKEFEREFADLNFGGKVVNIPDNEKETKEDYIKLEENIYIGEQKKMKF